MLALGLGATAATSNRLLNQFEFVAGVKMFMTKTNTNTNTNTKTKAKANLLKARMSIRSYDDDDSGYWRNGSSQVIGLFAVVLMFSSTAVVIDPLEETLANVPQTLSGECVTAKDCKKGRIQHPKSRQAESCTIKCVTTCIRGGAGSPGEGPFNARRPLVVFKQGFRSRQYCLVECSDICNLLKDGEDGP